MLMHVEQGSDQLQSLTVSQSCCSPCTERGGGGELDSIWFPVEYVTYGHGHRLKNDPQYIIYHWNGHLPVYMVVLAATICLLKGYQMLFNLFLLALMPRSILILILVYSLYKVSYIQTRERWVSRLISISYNCKL